MEARHRGSWGRTEAVRKIIQTTSSGPTRGGEEDNEIANGRSQLAALHLEQFIEYYRHDVEKACWFDTSMGQGGGGPNVLLLRSLYFSP